MEPRRVPAGTIPPGALSELLVELSVAVHKHAMYPAGHPAIAALAEGVIRRAARVLAERDYVSIGAGRHQLVVDGQTTDPGHPVVRRLADTLQVHQLGAISLLRGIQPWEVAEALLRLSREPLPGEVLGLLPPDDLPSWPHLRLHPLAFDRLAIVEEPPAGGTSPADTRAPAGDLWVSLAQLALAGGDEAAATPPADAGPDVIARAIDARSGVAAFDEAVTAYLRQIAESVRAAAGPEADALRASTSALIAALHPATLRRLVQASRGTRRQAFIGDAVQGLRVDAVLELLKATAEASGETISHGLIRMLTKLAAHARAGPIGSRGGAEDALRAQVMRLLADWKLADPNPEWYGRLLHHLSSVNQDGGGAGTTSGVTDADPRLVQMALELGEMGPLAEKALDAWIAGGDVAPLVALLESLPPEAGPAAAALRARLTSPAVLTRLLSEEPVNFSAIDRLLPAMSAADHEPLLDALAESQNRVTRRRLLDRLAQSPHDLSASIIRRLDDPRWHVQRNMLLLLGRSRCAPAGFSARRWMGHTDWRVRYEAARVALGHDAQRDDIIEAALADPHPRVVGLALAALADGWPPGLVPRVADMATDPARADEMRIKALVALARGPAPDVARRTLARLLDGGRWWWRRRLAPASPVCLAALRVAAERHAADPALAPYLALARRSSNPEVRAAATP